MKKNVILVIASAIAFSLLFVFFSSRFQSPENAMVPPKPSKENAAILQAFEDSIGHNTDYQLRYPQSGKYRNAFIFHDLDGDGVNEVMVFYTSSTSESTARINVLDRQKGKWVSVFDDAGYGMDIYSVDFDDLNGDKTPEVLLSWLIVPNNQTKRLTVQKFKINAKSRLEMISLLDQQYRYMGTADMDGDSRDELLMIWSNNNDEVSQTYASLFKMDGSSAIHSYGKRAVLDNGVSGYSALKFQKSGGQTVAFLDAQKGEHAMITELIWWDKGKQALIAPLSHNDALRNSATYRPARIPSRDIDGDSAIEIPLPAPDSVTNPKSLKDTEKAVPLVCWYSVKINGDDVQLVPKEYTLVNTNEQYILRVSPGQIRNILAIRDQSGVLTVYNYQSGKRGEPLFSIVISEKNKLQREQKYTFRVDHGDLAAFGTLTNVGTRRGFTNDAIEQDLLFY